MMAASRFMRFLMSGGTTASSGVRPAALNSAFTATGLLP